MDPRTSVFLTPDRFADKYCHLSPYQYAANNPINLIDINGDSLWITHRIGFLGLWGKEETLLYKNGNLYNRNGSDYEGYINGFMLRTVAALDEIRCGNDGRDLINQVQSSDKNVTISRGSNSYSFENVINATNGVGSNGSIKWAPLNKFGGPNAAGNSKRPSYIGLAHELAHALDGAKGTMNGGLWFSMSNGSNVFNLEQYATHWENKIRAENELPLRTHYQPGYSESSILINGTQSRFFNNYDYISNSIKPNYIKIIIK